MSRLLASIVPILFLLTFIICIIKKIKIYDVFIQGVKKAVPLILSIFPYLASIMMLSEVFRLSGLEEQTIKFLTPIFEKGHIPKEIAELVLIKPLSGSGATAVLANIVKTYGADSYAGKCACVVFSSTETIFYIGAVYFAECKQKKLTIAFSIALFSYIFSIIFSCLLCKIL